MLLHNVPELLSRTSLCPGMHCDTEAAARGGHSQNPEKMSGAQRLGLVTHVPCCRVPPQPVNAHTLSNVFLSFLCGWHGFGWCRSWRRHCCFARSKRPLCVRSHKRATTAVSTRVVTPCHSPRNLFQYAVAVAQKLCVCVCVWVQLIMAVWGSQADGWALPVQCPRYKDSGCCTEEQNKYLFINFILIRSLCGVWWWCDQPLVAMC